MVRGTSFDFRLTQYLQSYTHWFVIKTLSREIQRPSAAKLWQMPPFVVLPIWPGFARRSTPLEVHATSYFAESAKISSFWNRSMLPSSPRELRHLVIKQYNTAAVPLRYIESILIILFTHKKTSHSGPFSKFYSLFLVYSPVISSTFALG